MEYGKKYRHRIITTDIYDFIYDADAVMAVKVNGITTYYYAKNLQGDIVAILNTSGTAVVEYNYDAWGNLISITGSEKYGLGVRNPLRYRGYVYDTETGLYYLNSRYYNPEMGRFINADSYVSTGQGVLGNNMFAYCLNNPVRQKDIQGTTSVDIFDDDGNPLTDDDKRFDGGKIHSNGPGGGGNGTGNQGKYPGGGSGGDAGNAGASVGGKKITLYRSMSYAEYDSTMSSQEFAAGSNSYEDSKFFATTYENATQWGELMYPNGDFKVMEATFDVKIISSPHAYFWISLDGIGAAYCFNIAATNQYMVAIR